MRHRRGTLALLLAGGACAAGALGLGAALLLGGEGGAAVDSAGVAAEMDRRIAAIDAVAEAYEEASAAFAAAQDGGAPPPAAITALIESAEALSAALRLGGATEPMARAGAQLLIAGRPFGFAAGEAAYPDAPITELAARLAEMEGRTAPDLVIAAERLDARAVFRAEAVAASWASRTEAEGEYTKRYGVGGAEGGAVIGAFGEEASGIARWGDAALDAWTRFKAAVR